MALGRNLKKKTLLPAEGEQKKPKKSKPATRALKTAPAKKTEKKTSPAKAESPPVREMPSGLLRKDEYERRQTMHRRFSEEISSLQDKRVHLIVFEIENEQFAIEIMKVNEVVLTPAITKMPQAPRYIPGIATIRGKGIVMIDLALKLGLTPGAENLADRSEYTIVVRTERFTAGIVVPNVPYNQVVDGGSIQEASDSISETAVDETYIKGLVKAGDRVMFFIDIDELIEGDRLKARVVKE